MRRQADTKKIAVVLENQTGPFPVMGDYARLRQMFICESEAGKGSCFSLVFPMHPISE